MKIIAEGVLLEMLRSLMTAVTGVRAHQTMLDVTGNNVANVNTPGFKRDITVFQDLLYQTTQGATGPGAARGGVNAAQIGLGVRLAAIETIHEPGASQPTGNRTDMRISGDGFFVFRDGGSNLFSRAGNFTLDRNFDLVHSGTGYRVQGYQMMRSSLDPTAFVMDGALSDIRIPMGDKMDARETSVIGLRCNLNSATRPYLPIGFKDIPFGGAAGNGEDATIIIEGVPYRLTASTAFNSPTPATPPSIIEDYITYTLDTQPPSGSTVPISFAMTSITPQGMPVLSLMTAGAPVGSLTIRLPGSSNDTTVLFDGNSGTLSFTNAAGATLWETNVTQGMDYFSFTGTHTDATTTPPINETYQFMMEFHEDKMNGSPLTATVWWSGSRYSGSIYYGYTGKGRWYL